MCILILESKTWNGKVVRLEFEKIVLKHNDI